MKYVCDIYAIDGSLHSVREHNSDVKWFLHGCDNGLKVPIMVSIMTNTELQLEPPE